MKFTIVTPTLNCRQYLPLTLQSILSQQGDFSLQCLVIDGGSRDGTVEYLGQLGDERVRFISQADGGQAEAINRGMGMAEGEVVAWLNGDDLYVPGALEAVRRFFSARPEAQWLAGHCQIIDAEGKIIRQGVSSYKDRHLRYYSYRALLRENMICQPAVFWRRGFGGQIGPLDESLHYTMDYDLWLRMGLRARPAVMERILAQFRLYPTSKSGRVDRRQFYEQYEVARRYLGADWVGRVAHRVNIEKIVWAYRAMRWIGY